MWKKQPEGYHQQRFRQNKLQYGNKREEMDAGFSKGANKYKKWNPLSSCVIQRRNNKHPGLCLYIIVASSIYIDQSINVV